MGMNLKDIFNDAENKINEINKRAKAEIAQLQEPIFKASVELFSAIGWNNWSEQDLKNDEQYARLQKTFTDKMELVSINYGEKSGQVRSSAVYDITGDGCTCRDCSIRKKPCKHMYFLAMHLMKGETALENLQLTLDDNNSKIKKADNFTPEFGQLGCCSLFRDCSRAGHCLQKDDYFKQCGYRKNLEKGKVFYTEKANGFSQERYDYIENFRNSLNEDEQSAFDEVVIYFEKTKHGCDNCFCLSSKSIEDIVTKCEVFESLPTKELVRRVFEAGLISNTRAAEFHNKYSKLPAPELKPTLPPLADNATKSEKESRVKENQKINAKNLKTWENHYLSDPSLQEALAKQFLYFQNNDYRFELGEFFVQNVDKITKRSENLVFFDATMPKNFRDKII